MSLQSQIDPEQLIRQRFSESGVNISSLEGRDYPQETIFVVRVEECDVDKAAAIGNEIDRELADQGFDGFVTVRKVKPDDTSPSVRLERGVGDKGATELVNLVTARSRTSEIQPSLSYIPDTANNISTVTAPRHHLIFGRRGAGKTALMVEAKRLVEAEGHLSIWINLQTLRHEAANRAFLWVCKSLCELIQTSYRGKDRAPLILTSAVTLQEDVDRFISARQVTDEDINRLIPRLQSIIRRFLESNTVRLYIFIDELHYLLPRSEQPKLLDMIHGAVRDCDAWLKIAGIKHLSRWFQTSPPLGLQTGQDADHIDLDITLENPSDAKTFLETVLRSYAKHVGITSLSRVLSKEALDRLVLASGAVPRDYLVLSAGAIRQAQKREKARLVGVQDVNKAAGEAANVKITELEDDVASTEGTTQTILSGLRLVGSFCLDEQHCTYFRIDFRDKEKLSAEYNIMQNLMDLRLLHLVNASLSDEHEAGRRFEVFMLDLSQFSGQRLKKYLKVLDFEASHIVLKETGTKTETKIGSTPKQRLGLLRRGPLFELNRLSKVVAQQLG